MRTAPETLTTPDANGVPHTWTYAPTVRHGRTIIGTFPIPGKPGESLMIAWPEVPRLTERLRLAMVREALQRVGHPLADTATDAQVLHESRMRLARHDFLEVDAYTCDGRPGIGYRTENTGGSRDAAAFTYGETL